jgi:group I intron endonuclease
MSEIANTEWNTIGETPNESEKNLLPDTTPKKLIGIYGLRNKINGKWYVGQGAGKTGIKGRWNEYKRLGCKNQPKIYNALLKYGYENFDKIIIEECDDIDWILNYREMYWIRVLDSVQRGYNCTNGGGGAPLKGLKHSEESRKKMSLRAKGRKFSEEHKQKIRLSKIGKKRNPFSKEWKINMAHSLLGRKHSEETKQKIRNSHFGITPSEGTRDKLRIAAINQWKIKNSNTLSESLVHNEKLVDDSRVKP